jgi:LmbE family N-acetylglucosaminyl deacetylase
MKILVISAHPDDETLGCGGTLLKHHAKGDVLNWLISTQTGSPRWTKKIVQAKAAEVERVTKAYGMRRVYKLGFPSAELELIRKTTLMKEIDSVISAARPNLIYLVHQNDIHTDHQIVFSATMSVLKPIHMARLKVQKVLSYETLSSTEAAPPLPFHGFSPGIFIDITPYMERKIQIMSLYASEAQKDPFPRGPSAIRALARFRGASAGVRYAEAFMLIRELA